MKSLLPIFLCLIGLRAFGNHLVGGYIQLQPTGGSVLTQQITLTLLYNEGPAADDANTLPICFGDGATGVAYRQTRQPLSNDRTISSNVYRIQHTYAGPGTYTVTTVVPNRSNVVNISNAAESELTLTTTAVVNASFSNQSPVFNLPETNFRVGVNQRVTLPLGATDREGDSLVYALALPLTVTSTGADLCNSLPITVSSYQFPNDQTRKGTFRIDARTGSLTWNTPTAQGPFSVAMTVGEYRNGVLLSRTQREITLTVIDQLSAPSPLPPYEPAFVGPATPIITALPTDEAPGMRLVAFPNPVDSYVQVIIQTISATPATVQLFDANGRLIHQLRFDHPARRHEQRIGIDNVASGQYVVRAVVNGQVLTQKIVKK